MKKTKSLILYSLLYSSKIWCSAPQCNLNSPFSPTNECLSCFCLSIRKKKGFKKQSFFSFFLSFFLSFHSSLQNSLLFSFSIFIWPTFPPLPPKERPFSSLSPSLQCNHAAWTGTPRGGLRSRKAKFSGEVACMEVSHHRATHGVRTRARTLAAATADSSLAYLELRSRRLAKPSLLCVDPWDGSAKSHHPGPTSWERATQNLRKGSEPVVEVDHFDVEATERRVRETTPCCSIRESDMIIAPGSTTRPTASSVNDQRRHAISQHIPSQQDLEEFFGNTEQHHQQSLQEKYNFDFVNENPLPGRYEWVEPDFF